MLTSFRRVADASGSWFCGRLIVIHHLDDLCFALRPKRAHVERIIKCGALELESCEVLKVAPGAVDQQYCYLITT